MTTEVAIFSSNAPIQIFVDAVLRETHALKATPTRFAIENGSVVSDHIIVEPEEISIEFKLSNLSDEGEISSGDTLPYQPATTKFAAMRKSLIDRELHEVVTDNHIYENMALVGIDAEREGAQLGSLEGVLQFQQIPIATPAVVVTQTTVPQQVGKTNSGRISAKSLSTSLLNAIESVYGVN